MPKVDEQLGRRKRKLGISQAEYDELRLLQHDLCAICGKPEKLGKLLAVDHDHETGKIRGLLCFFCNTRLYLVENGWVAKALDYLRRHNASCV